MPKQHPNQSLSVHDEQQNGLAQLYSLGLSTEIDDSKPHMSIAVPGKPLMAIPMGTMTGVDLCPHPMSPNKGFVKIHLDGISKMRAYPFVFARAPELLAACQKLGKFMDEYFTEDVIRSFTEPPKWKGDVKAPLLYRILEKVFGRWIRVTLPDIEIEVPTVVELDANPYLDAFAEFREARAVIRSAVDCTKRHSYDVPTEEEKEEAVGRPRRD